MGRKSRLKEPRRKELGNAELAADPTRRRLLGLGIGAFGLSAVGGTVVFWYRSRESLEDMIAPYGRIIHEQNQGAEKTLYIVGQVHEKPGQKADMEVAHSQLQVYRIIEAIGLHLGSFPSILEEGRIAETDYFEDAQSYKNLAKTLRLNPNFLKSLTDQHIIENVMSGSAELPTSAAFLVNVVYGSGYQGWEDEDVNLRHTQIAQAMIAHRADLDNIIERIERGEMVEYDSQISRERMDELRALTEYLSSYRSLIILQNSPRVLEREFEKGRLKKLQGIGVIGRDHLGKIVRYMVEGRANIKAINPKYFTQFGTFPGINETIDLSGYNVVIIQPNEFVRVN